MHYLWVYLSKKNCEIFLSVDEGEGGGVLWVEHAQGSLSARLKQNLFMLAL